ncbi:MAG: hypothetical protein VYC34_11860, partial [Planctomycetota bacterium]|nr:hypothetical protein [Planctomycetota bacterium]
MSAFARTSAPAVAARPTTREDLIRLGQSGQAWTFLPLAMQAVRQQPHDHAMRLLAAANFARLGLRTAAAEQIDRVPQSGEFAGPSGQLRGVLDALANDRIAASRLDRTCGANIERLRQRGVDVGPAWEAWRARLPRLECFLANDGNVAVRAAGAGPDGEWTTLRDDQRLARAPRLPHVAGVDVNHPNAPLPYVLEGVNPPWLLLRIWKETPPGPDRFQPRIDVVQADADELLTALAIADLRDVIADERVAFHVGHGAGESLGAALRARPHLQTKSVIITSPFVGKKSSPPAAEVVSQALAEQQRLHADLKHRADAVYAARDEAWWSNRYREAASGGEPLRVLIPTSRYTTFVQHSARDLAGAFERAGCDVRLVIEPDDFSRLASPAYLREFAEWQPDLVVLINFTRSQMGAAVAANVPFVTWVQDSLGHLFDAKVGRAQGRFDFLAGSLFPSLFEQFEYPRERALTIPVVASPEKFHSAPVDAAARRRLECEIAYVSHQSEPAEQWFGRQVAALHAPREVREALESIRDEVIAAAIRVGEASPFAFIRSATIESLRSALRREPEEQLVTLALNQIAFPLADRAVRHQTLEWAAEIARRRGWRLRIHGAGWERHPSLAEFARPALAHDDELRACHQAASVFLHASVNSGVHQRVIECAMSGGMPLCRLNHDDLYVETLRAQGAAARRGPFTFSSIRGRHVGVLVADHPELMSLTRLRQRLGLKAPVAEWYPVRGLPDHMSAEGPPNERRLLWILGDPADLLFRDAAQLEQRVEQAIDEPSRRAAAGE